MREFCCVVHGTKSLWKFVFALLSGMNALLCFSPDLAPLSATFSLRRMRCPRDFPSSLATSLSPSLVFFSISLVDFGKSPRVIGSLSVLRFVVYGSAQSLSCTGRG